MRAVLVHFPGFPWHCLMQDSAASLLPTFLKLIESGASGLCAPVGPHPLMDGVIMTGVGPIDNGLLTWHEERADGFGLQPASTFQLKTPAVWQHLDAAGLRCASVNMLASQFGKLQHGIIISDAYCEIRAARFDSWGIPPGAVSPLSLCNVLADCRVHPEDLETDQIFPFLVDERPDEDGAKPRIVAKVLAENSTAHAAATYLLEHECPDFCAVRYPALAQLQAGFASPAALRPGIGAAWSFLRLLDAFLARLLELAGQSAIFFITGGTESAPFWIASGPGVAKDILWPRGVSLYDVAPSLLALFGIKPVGMMGELPTVITAGEARAAMVAPQLATSPAHLESAAQVIECLFASGMKKNGPSKEQVEMLAKQRFRQCFALGENARLEARNADAIDAYTDALEIRPEDSAALIGLCRSLARTCRAIEARAVYERLLKIGAKGFEVLLADAEIAVAEGRLAHAQDCISQVLNAGKFNAEQLAQIRMLEGRLHDAIGKAV